MIGALLALVLATGTGQFGRQAVYDIPTPTPVPGLAVSVPARILVVDKLVGVSCTLDGAPGRCAYELRTTANALLGIGGPDTILLTKGGLRAASLAPAGIPVVIRASAKGLRTSKKSRLYVQNLRIHVTNPGRLRALARTLRAARVDHITCRGPRAPARAACGVLRDGGASAEYEVAATRGSVTLVVTYALA